MAPAALPQFKRKARIFAAAEHHAFGTRSTLPHHLKELNAGNYSVALVEDLQERLADPFLYIAAVHTGIATVHTYAYFDALKNARNMRTVAEGYGGNACPKGSPRSSSPAAAENFVAPNNVRPPASRHTLSRVNQRTVAKDLNSVVEPGVDVAADVRLINQGQVTKVGDTYIVNGRTYGVHDGTLFPISGPGIHQLNRPAFKALGVFNQFGDTAKARQILENMARTNPSLNQEAIDAALRAWRAGGRR